MNVLIIEDEHLGFERLAKLLREVAPELHIAGHTDSIRSTVQWLREHPMPDLVFMDIELADGQCFEIFKQVDLGSPIIFTTSYDEYALHAFKVNSIDYLLKPVRKDELQRSLNKLRQLQGGNTPDLERLLQAFGQKQSPSAFRKRFLVRQRQRMFAVEMEEIAFFAADGKICWLKTWDNRRFLLDYTLEQLTEMVDPELFFRVNRSYLVHIKSIRSVLPHLNGKLLLVLEPAVEQNDVLVSKERASVFKNWMGK